MMPSKDYILFLDLECTGNIEWRPDKDQRGSEILEVGLVMVQRVPSLPEVERKNIILPVWQNEIDEADQVVVDMHTKSGLWTDCLAAGEGLTDRDRPRILKELDLYLAGWMKQFSKKSHILVAGSGVAWYDRQYIKRDLPFFNSTLTYKVADMSAIREVLGIANVQIRTTQFGFKTHRAVEDAAFHAREMRDFLKFAQRRELG
jgi:oligoribonuclease (3'-5' exoribonuclease)